MLKLDKETKSQINSLFNTFNIFAETPIKDYTNDKVFEEEVENLVEMIFGIRYAD